MTAVSNRDFTDIATDGESLAQRLGDALRFPRGSVPGARDYGSYLYEAVDRNITPAVAGVIYSAVAEAITHEANGLQDIQLQSIRLDSSENNTLAITVSAYHDGGVPVVIPVIV